jgi:hypothetical protein
MVNYFSAPERAGQRAWVVWIALIVISTIPLWYPSVPPLNDLPGHMGRYAVQLAQPSSTLLNWYQFDWHIIGNLGVDLLIVPSSHIFGIEVGTKIIVIATVATTTAGMLWVAREAHGEVPATALIALPFVYGNPFNFGFVNFSLSSALAFVGFGLWLHLARVGRLRLRSVIFVPVAYAIWLAHTYGWGVLGILCAAAEIVRQRDQERSWPAVAWRTCIACVPLALPLLALFAWRSHAHDMTGRWFDWNTKFSYLIMTLRDRWMMFDIASLGFAFAIILAAAAHPALRFSRSLGTAAGMLFIVFLLLPRIIFGSAYADMRLTPWIFAIALLAIQPATSSPRLAKGLLLTAALFFGVRLCGTTISFVQISARWDRALGALYHLPRGSSVAAFTRWTCRTRWSTDRLDHLAAMAMVRRESFSNDQWIVSGANLLTVVRHDARGFLIDPSQLTPEKDCGVPASINRER